MSEHEHVFANPSPAGLSALAMACMVLWAAWTGKVDGGKAAPLIGCWFVGGGILQVSVGLMELRNGVFKSGNVMLMFGAFFMWVGVFGMFTKWLAANLGWAIDGRIEGYAWLVCALVLIGWTPGYFKNSPLFLTIAVLIVDVALVLIAFADMGLVDKGTFLTVAAWLLFIVSLLAIYLSAAVFTNTALGKEVFPVKML